jgi:RHS repeat-associated protein
MSSNPTDSDPFTNAIFGSWSCDYNDVPEGFHTEQLAYTFHNQGAAPGVPPPPGYPQSCSAQTQFDFHVDGTSPTLTAVYPKAPVPFPAGFPGMVVSSSDTVRLLAEDNLMLCEITASTGPDAFGFYRFMDLYRNLAAPDGFSPFAPVYAAGATSKAASLRLSEGAGPITVQATDCAGLVRTWNAPFKVDSQFPRLSINLPAGVVTLPGGEGISNFTGLAGTASDDIGLARLEVQVQESGTGRWWDGTAFIASGDPIRILLGETIEPTTSWAFTSLTQAPVPQQGATWNVRVFATDFVGRSTQAYSPIIVKPPVIVSRVRPRGQVDARGPKHGGFTNPMSGTWTECQESVGRPARSPALAIALSHNSQGGRDSVWGFGWSTEHDQLLLVRNSGVILWKDGGGSEFNFFPPPPGAPDPDTFLTPVQSFTTLVVTARTPAGKPSAAELRMKGGDTTTFAVLADGFTLRPTGLVDRNGNTVTYTRDAQGRLTRAQDVHGRRIDVTYAGGRVSQVAEETGRSVTYAYDGAGNRISETGLDGTTAYEYDSAHRITAIVYPNESRRTMTYDAKGRVLTEQDAGGVHRLTYAYYPSSTVVMDALGNATLYDATSLDGLKRPSRVTDAGGGETAFVYDGAFNVASLTDPADRTTAFAYDARGNVLSLTDPANGVTGFTYENVFDQPLTVTDPRANTTVLTYDGEGNLTRVTDPLARQTQLTYDAQGHVLTVTDARLKTTAFTYDAQGGLAAVTDPLSRTTTLTRDPVGRVTSSQDPAGKATRFQYDAAGNLTRVTDEINGVTAYAYDPGRESRLLASVTDAKSQPTAFSYDPTARLTAVTNALGQAKTFSYDLKGNLAGVTDPRGQVTTFAYDTRDRLTSKTTPEESVTYAYDAVGNLTSAQKGNGIALSFAYDALDRVTQVVQTLQNGFTAAIGYAYDANGNRTAMTTPWGNFSYAYDAMNRLTFMSAPGNQAFTFEYDELGRRTRLAYPNGTEALYTYDDASQLTNIEFKSNGFTFGAAGYTYDAAGNRTSMTDVIGTHLYEYDGLHRLSRAEHPAGWPFPSQVETFSYDAVGNRLADDKVTGYQYNAANRLLETSARTYAYDAAGNTTGMTDKLTNQTTAYAYGADNLLENVTLPGSFVEFAYDALGRRVEKTIGSQTRFFIYDNEDILAVLDGSNNLITLFTHGPGIDEPLAVKTGTSAYFAHADGLGSVAAHTDATGNPVERIFYEVYGAPFFVDFRGGGQAPEPCSFTGSPYAYTAREWDCEFGMSGYRPRELDHFTGRFMQEDPIGIVGGINLFTYAANRPTLLTDPNGLASKRPDYYSLNFGLTPVGSLFGYSGQITLDRFGQIYIAPIGVSAGISFPTSVSFVAGEISDVSTAEFLNPTHSGHPAEQFFCKSAHRRVRESELRNFLSGLSIALGGGVVGAYNRVTVPGTGFAHEVGFTLPQYGITTQYTFPLPFKIPILGWKPE